MKKAAALITLFSLVILAFCWRIQANALNFDDVEWIGGGSIVLAPGEETVYADKIEFVSDGADFLYHLNYGAQFLNLTFGLQSADGAQYSREIVGGHDHGVIEDLPAGSYHLFVKNSGDYSQFPTYQDHTVSYDITGAFVYAFRD